MGVSVGRMRGFSPRSAEKFRLGTEDAMTYYPYTILGGEDNYQTAPDNAGIWEIRAIIFTSSRFRTPGFTVNRVTGKPPCRLYSTLTAFSPEYLKDANSPYLFW